ncbi:hypothetical protein [Pseudochrobactrum asaccharolyticum]|uniref:Uncharacterized protein n=1 Tax=Pseudochrobactrum asaccharolyticum TaxID=354351 RepID=A0A366DKA7_9HYPH|nr:hypothetical protein [Pseudochrobactrum asaccharolyticum]RBO90510.1 hypothetical protein DFR47_11371 [Pseudochrobactrum asaccharolyticum]
MAIFDRLDKHTSRTVDAINAIPFILTPYLSSPNGRGIVDPNRKVIQGKGIFDYYEVEYGLQLGVRRSYREANDMRSLQSGREPYLSVDRKFFKSLDDEAIQGDLIKLPTRPELPTFQIVAAHRDGLARVILTMVQEGAQA